MTKQGLPGLSAFLLGFSLLLLWAPARVWPAQACCPDSNSIITTVAGTGTSGYIGDGGPATSAQLNLPYDVLVDPSGNLFICELENGVVRKVSPGGIITTFAGNGTAGYSGDGGPAVSAQLSYPTYIAEDSSGNIYICEFVGNRIRKVDTSGIITTFAGNGTPGYSGDGGAATSASLNTPYGIAVDGAGNVYIADMDNYAIRKITPSGIITTIAGNGTPGYSGDGGPAVSALLSLPEAISIDPSGNLFFYDDPNGYVRKIDTAGIITSVFNTGVDTEGIAFCGGNLYLSDFNYQIREVTGGVAAIIAGTGDASESGDGGPASLATLNQPMGMCMDSLGNLYVADISGCTVRKIAPVCPPTPTSTPTNTPAFSMTPTPSITPTPACEPHVWPDPFNPKFAVGGALKISCVPSGSQVAIYTLTGEKVWETSQTSFQYGSYFTAMWDGKNQKGGSASPGIYYYVIRDGDQVSLRGKFILVRMP